MGNDTFNPPTLISELSPHSLLVYHIFRLTAPPTHNSPRDEICLFVGESVVPIGPELLLQLKCEFVIPFATIT